VKIDLHVHTAYSIDATGTPAEVLAGARKAGLDGIAITDHESYEKAEIFLKLAPVYGLLVFAGAEVATKCGHFLVFSEKIARWNRFCGAGGGGSPGAGGGAQELIEAVNRAGGAVIAAHPYRAGFPFGGSQIRMLGGLAAIEVCNGGNTPEENRRAGELAAAMALPGTGGSDAHRVAEIGRCYTVFDVPVRTVAELAGALKAGRCAYGPCG
jgi:predicted metal-dependent phosphoesterase TrpH